MRPGAGAAAFYLGLALPPGRHPPRLGESASARRRRLRRPRRHRRYGLYHPESSPASTGVTRVHDADLNASGGDLNGDVLPTSSSTQRPSSPRVGLSIAPRGLLLSCRVGAAGDEAAPLGPRRRAAWGARRSGCGRRPDRGGPSAAPARRRTAGRNRTSESSSSLNSGVGRRRERGSGSVTRLPRSASKGRPS